jgi:hypothetical protein
VHAADRAAADSSVPPQGVQLIHTVPAGVACVRDQMSLSAPVDGDYDAFIGVVYKDATLGQTLAAANDLVPDTTGGPSVYVPPGLPVVLPAMCYFKEGADAVTLEPGGVPKPSGSSAADVATGWLIFAVILLFAAFVIKRLT